MVENSIVRKVVVSCLLTILASISETSRCNDYDDLTEPELCGKVN